jgi:hypothetical protein
MPPEGPEIERLVRRLAECPGEFLATAAGRPDYVAIVCDHMRRMAQDFPPERSPGLTVLRRADPAHLELSAVVCWMLHDDWFLDRPDLAPGMWALLVSDVLKRLAELVKPAAFVADPDRREELARTCLKSLAIIPKGETATQAADRLTALDSVERHRVLKGTAAAERRAREVREAMAKKKAQESASRYGE